MTQPLQQKTLMSLDVLMRLFYSPCLYYTYVKNDGSIQEAWHCVPLMNPVNGLVLTHPPLEILPKNLF